MKLILLFSLFFVLSNVLGKSEYESTDEDESVGHQKRQDCATNELLVVLEKLSKVETKHLEEMNIVKSQFADAQINHSEEMNIVKSQLADAQIKHSEELAKVDLKYSEELAKVDKKHSEELAKVDMKYSQELAKVDKKHSEELAKVNMKNSEEVNAVKLELAEVKIKHTEKLANVEIKHLQEINTLKDDVATAKTNCSEEVKKMEIKLIDALELMENERKIDQDEFGKMNFENTQKMAQHMAEITTLKNDAMVEFKSTLEEKPMAIFSVFSNNSETLPANSFIGFDYHYIENRGNNFDLTDGIFTAPYKGIYEFAYSGNGPSSATVAIQVLKNDLVINRFYSGYTTYAHVSPSWICSLEKGDTIRLQLSIGRKLYTENHMYRTFSGKLLSRSP